jgi:hypothetical protein
LRRIRITESKKEEKAVRSRRKKKGKGRTVTDRRAQQVSGGQRPMRDAGARAR